MNETDGGQICKDALKIRSRQCLNNWPSGKRNYTVYIVSNKDKFLAFRNHASDQENRIIVSGAFSRYEYVSICKI